VDFADAKASQLTYASVKNKDGSYVAPSVTAASEAASNAQLKPDLTFSAIWAPGATSYPITAQSWVLLYQKQSSSNTTKMLKAYVGYLVGDGQKLLAPLGYATLPSNIDQQAKAQVSKIGT
jgi:phosphate transport system substrate-binding protein